MKTTLLLIFAALAGIATAFPPAPHHEIYGTVRDEMGRPLVGGARVDLIGPQGRVATGTVAPGSEPGVNYSIKVPVDSGKIATLYQPSAMFPSTPFTVRVVINSVAYVPIEVQAASPDIGVPGGRTRVNLTLGVDSDGDGLPDAWERQLVNLTSATSIEEVTPDGDLDGDGVSNYLEYIAGTYAFSRQTSFRLEIVSVEDGMVHLRFLAANGRTYTIDGAANGGGFARVPFSFNRSGADPVQVHLSGRVRYEDVYVPVGEFPTRLFRLNVY